MKKTRKEGRKGRKYLSVNHRNLIIDVRAKYCAKFYYYYFIIPSILVVVVAVVVTGLVVCEN